MNKQAAMKWIKALRSGRYKQGSNHLRRRNNKGELNYCCLGVLCNMIAPKKWKPDGRGSFAIGGYQSIITDSIGCKVDLKSSNGEFLPHQVKWPASIPPELRPWRDSALVDLNDIYCLTFNQIADFIELNYEKL